MITDRLTKLTRVVPLRKITAYNIAVAFVEHWVVSYGPPECVISDNGKQFAASSSQQYANCLGFPMYLRRHTTPRRMGR